MIKFVSNGGYAPHDIELPIDYNDIYDTTERQIGYCKVTGGYKPLYRKSGTIIFTAIKTWTYSNQKVFYDTEMVNVKGVFSPDGIGACNNLYNTKIGDGSYNTSNGGIANNIYIDNNSTSQYYGYIAGFIERNDMLSKTFFVVGEYTKTTDTVITEIPYQTIPGVVQKVIDTVPVGTELDYDGEEVPSGWEEIDEVEDLTSQITSTAEIINNVTSFKKCGNVYSMTVGIARTNQAWSSGDVIASIPSAYAPEKPVIASAWGGGNSLKYIIVLDQNGAIKVNGTSMSESTWLEFSLTYIK